MTGVVTADSTFDPAVFGENMRSFLDFNTVGYAYAVNYDGQPVAASGTGGINGTNGGFARTDADLADPLTSLAFNTNTRTEVASVSKIITTSAILKLLDSTTPDLDAALDAPISTYLPADWTIGPNVNLITIRHLLTHTSGFQEGGSTDPANLIGVNFESFGNNTMQNLRALVAAGHPNASNPPTQTLPNGDPSWARTYSNANFSLLAKMVPYMRPDVSNDYLDGIADPNDFFLDFVSPDSVFGALYEEYVRENILEPAGINNPSMDPPPGLAAKGYNLATTTATNGGVAGYTQSDMTNTGGAFGWKLSAPDLSRFLYAIEHNNAVLSSTARALMNAEDFVLGWGPVVSGSNPVQLAPIQDAFGNYFQHGGAAGNSAGDFRSQVVVFPGNIEASLVLNDDGATLPQSRFALMQESYVNAWTELTVDGSAAADDFVLSMNPSATVPSLDLFINGVLQFTHYIDTFDSLTLRGLNGNDTFAINALPSTLDLTIFGQSGNDSLVFGAGDVDTNTRGSLTFNGGSSSDSIIYNDASDSFADSYTITSNSISKSSSPGSFQYSSVADLELRANGAANQIAVTSNTGVTVTILGGNGDDTIVLGDGNISGNLDRSITVNGQGGQDELILDDRNGNSQSDTYVFQADYFSKNAFGGLIWNQNTEEIWLRGTDNDSTTNIRGTQPNQRIQVDGDEGADVVQIHETAIGSQIVLYTGNQNDTVRVTPEDQDLDAISGRIWVNMGNGTADRMYIRDDNDAGNDNYTITSDRFDKSNFDQLTYYHVDDMYVYANEANNTISVTSLDTETSLRVFAGAGNDTVQVGDGDLDDTVLGDLSLYGQAGNDTLQIRDQDDVVDNTLYEFSKSSFTKTGVDNWYHSSFENASINAGMGDNTIDVSSFGGFFTDGLLTVNAGSGNDDVVIGEGYGRVDFINDNVHVIGGLGVDTVTVDESNALSDRDYRIEGSLFEIDNSALFSQLTVSGSVEEIVVKAGQHDDHFDVRSTPSSLDVDLRGNNGDDSVELASVSHDLDSVGGRVKFSGGTLIGGGTDTVTLHDDSDVGPDSYTLTTTGLFGSGEVAKVGFLMTHGSVETITLDANNDSNAIEISGSNSIFNPDYVINSGAGDDTVTVNAPAFSYISIHGADGEDLVTVVGTASDDTATVQGETIQIGTTTVVTDDTVERRRLDTGDGSDLMVVDGVATIDEMFRIEAWGSPGAGVLYPGPFSPVQFSHLEDIDVQGNVANQDRLVFMGTERDDYFSIDLAADGTATNPVVQLNNGFGQTLLRLRNFANVDAPLIDGRDGADTFRVTVSPDRGSPVRDIRLDGGPLSGKEGGDALYLHHNANVTDKSSPKDGYLQYVFNTEAYDIVFEDFESIFV